MDEKNIKVILDTELENLKLTSNMRNNIKANLKNENRRYRSPLKIAVSIVASFVLCFSTIYAGYYITSKVNVNDETLPELDPMNIVKIDHIDTSSNKDGLIEKNYNTYTDLQKQLGISLLNSDLSVESPYMRVNILTSIEKDYLIATVDNYILGDTSNFKLIPDIDRYTYDSGKQYYSPISLKVEMILSENQAETGLDKDFLGMYKFQESYISSKGYKVNIVTSTEGESINSESNSIVSEKCAIFVADGVRYTLKGRVSTELLKEILNTMN